MVSVHVFDHISFSFKFITNSFFIVLILFIFLLKIEKEKGEDGSVRTSTYNSNKQQGMKRVIASST